jgi:hypothetical protein
VDVIGVVNYVGRIERYEAYKSDVEYAVPAEGSSGFKRQNGEHRFFHAYRWITMIDQTCEKPLP